MHPKIFGKNLNNRQKLANHILEWSSDSRGGINLYVLGSNWLTKHEVPTQVVCNALREINAIIRKEVPFPETVTVATVKELEGLKAKIYKAWKIRELAIQKMELEDQVPKSLRGLMTQPA